MSAFTDDLIKYISSLFEFNEDYGKSVKVFQAFKQKKPVFPSISVQCVGDSEYLGGTTYEGEQVSTLLIQLEVYTQAMQIGNESYSAQEAANYIGEYLKKSLNQTDLRAWNDNICGIKRLNCRYGLPLDGTAYLSTLRYEFRVQYNYQKIN